MTIGENIRDRRKAQGLTQKELAEKVGVATITIQQYERNVREPRIEILEKIGSVLGIAWYNLYPNTSKTADESYESTLADACKWIEERQPFLPDSSFEEWDADKRNRWIRSQFNEAAKLFDVSIEDLKDEYPLYVDEAEYIENWVPETITLSTLVDKKQMAKIFLAMEKLSPEGQQVAVERVEELTQIPKYQRQDAPQDAPGGVDDEEPAEK